MVKMRLRQFRFIRFTYIVQNLFYIIEFLLYFNGRLQYGCSPNGTFAGLIKGICQVLPTQLYLITFWWIPRPFLLSYSQYKR